MIGDAHAGALWCGEDVGSYDLIVVGGGCNGTGTARDAALRGYRVLLLEKNDFGHGATGNSSGMIHGGSRYLQYDREVTRLSCLDSGFIQEVAKHLCFRIPFLVPVLANRRLPWFPNVYMTMVDTFFQEYDKFQPLKNGKPHTKLTAEEAKHLEPGLAPDVVGAITFDEWGIDTHRLCVANAISAAEAGAVVRNHHTVEALLRDGPSVVGVSGRDELTGRRFQARAKAVINATGAWSPRFGKLAGAEVQLRPGKGIHLIFDRCISDYGLITKAVDGRDVLMMPHEHHTVLGTTDDDFYGDPGDVTATYDEVEYLLQAFERVFPTLRDYRVVATWAGVRPTLFKYGKSESQLSRAHRLVDHADHGIPGLYSILGGKLAAFRIMSEETVDLVEPRLGRSEPCRTHIDPLPGAMPREGTAMEELAMALARQHGVEPYAATRIVFRHGTRAADVLALCDEDPTNTEVVDSGEPVLACELRYAIRNEWARTLPDLTRRCMFGAGADRGNVGAIRAGQILAQELGRSQADAREATRAFLDHAWADRVPVLDAVQLAQEEANLARNALTLNLDQVSG